MFALVVISIKICSFAAARTNVCDTAVGQVPRGSRFWRSIVSLPSLSSVGFLVPLHFQLLLVLF